MCPSSVPASPAGITTDWLSALVGGVISWSTTEIGFEYGLSGSTHRIDLELLGGASKSVVVKLAPATPTRREITFFEACAHRTPLPLPGFIDGATDRGADRGVVVLDYLQGTRRGDVLEGCTEAEAHTLAGMLARLHAAWWNDDDPGLRSLEDLGDDRVGVVPHIREGRLGIFLDRFDELADRTIRPWIEGLEDRAAALHHALGAGPTTLIHADYHLDNVLFLGSREPFIIDWQQATAGPPEVDVARFLVECLTTDQRSRYGPAALSTYVEGLGTAGIAPAADFEGRVLGALELLLPGIINWLGRPEPDPPESRKAALGRNMLLNTMAAIADFAPS